MEPYKNRKIRPWRFVSGSIRALAGLLRIWPLLLIGAIFMFPTSPHIRMQYTYEWRSSMRYMLDCDYLGVHGWIKYDLYGDCPVFMMLNAEGMR